MKVFLAGATGAIGTRLVPLLVRAGHTVTGATRHRDKAESIRAAGAFPAVVDALNPRAVLEAVQRAEPDVIIHQLTAIPARFNMRHFDQAFALTNRLRSAGTDHLLVELRGMALCPHGRVGQDRGGPVDVLSRTRMAPVSPSHSACGVGRA